MLLVEDDDACADFVIDAFAEAPETERATRVARLQEVRQQLATIPVDVVLLDLTLPDAFDPLGVNAIRNAAPDVALVVLTPMTTSKKAMSRVEDDRPPWSRPERREGHRAVLAGLRQAP